MGYYKEIEKACIDGERYSAVGTPGEMRKRGVEKDSCVTVNNKVVKIELVKYYETSGAIEYGMAVVLKCTLESGEQVQITEDGSRYLHWVQTHTTVSGVTEGDFLFIFKGVTVQLSVVGDSVHTKHVQSYEEQENKKQRIRKLDVQVGDIVNIYGRSVFLGDFYYFKPNLRKGSVHNKLRKYKLYIKLKDDGSYEEGELYVESGRTRYNQPTEILGNMGIDIGLLKQNAQERMDNIDKIDVGYYKSKGYYSSGYRAYERENDKAYVLVNASESKDGVVYPSKEAIMGLAWLCGWNVDGKAYKYKYRNNRDKVVPYEYEEAE